jgi:hypothetical protein
MAVEEQTVDGTMQEVEKAETSTTENVEVQQAEQTEEKQERTEDMKEKERDEKIKGMLDELEGNETAASNHTEVMEGDDKFPPRVTSEKIVLAEGVTKQLIKEGRGENVPSRHSTCFCKARFPRTLRFACL